MEKSTVPSIVESALEAEKRIADRLRELKAALESGQEERAIQIARKLTKARECDRAA